MAKLSYAALKGLIKKPGRHGDGAGLYFRVVGTARPTGSTIQRRRERCARCRSGPIPQLGLAEARAGTPTCGPGEDGEADPLRGERRAGADRGGAIPSFGEAADDYIAAHSRSWKNPGTVPSGSRRFTDYGAPIRDTPVNEIGTEAVLRTLQAIWTARLRSPRGSGPHRGGARRGAGARPYRSPTAPIRRDGAGTSTSCCQRRPRSASAAITPPCLTPTFPPSWPSSVHRRSRSQGARGHHPHRGERSEVLGMTWDEVMLAAELWSVSGGADEGGRSHDVPLSDAGGRGPARARGEGARRPSRRMCSPARGLRGRLATRSRPSPVSSVEASAAANTRCTDSDPVFAIGRPTAASSLRSPSNASRMRSAVRSLAPICGRR